MCVHETYEISWWILEYWESCETRTIQWLNFQMSLYFWKVPNRGRVVWRISIPGSDISLWPHHSLEGNPLPTGPTITPGRRKTHYIQYVKVVDIQQHLLENQYNSNNIEFPFHDSAYKIESVCSEIQRRGQMSLWMQYLVFFCQRKSTFSFNQHSEKLLWQPFWIFRIPTK